MAKTITDLTKSLENLQDLYEDSVNGTVLVEVILTPFFFTIPMVTWNVSLVPSILFVWLYSLSLFYKIIHSY